MATARDIDLLRQIHEAARVVESRLEGGRYRTDPDVADAALWRISLIGHAAHRLSPEVIEQHPEVDWAGVRRLHLVADGTLGGLTRDEVWRTVTSVLPLLVQAVEADLAGHGTEPRIAAEAVRRVLLVDDDADIRRILDLLLSHAGYAVTEASDGVEALALAREVRPHAVVADVQMPNMDGIEMVRQLRAMPELERAVVLLFTGKPPHEGLHQVLSLDQVRYMSKGDPRKVIVALEEMFAAVDARDRSGG